MPLYTRLICLGFLRHKVTPIRINVTLPPSLHPLLLIHLCFKVTLMGCHGFGIENSQPSSQLVSALCSTFYISFSLLFQLLLSKETVDVLLQNADGKKKKTRRRQHCWDIGMSRSPKDFASEQDPLIQSYLFSVNRVLKHLTGKLQWNIICHCVFHSSVNEPLSCMFCITAHF